MTTDSPSNPVTSVRWSSAGDTVAVGTASGYVSIWDAETQDLIVNLANHGSRVAALAWNEWTITSGSRDRSIYNTDTRCPDAAVQLKDVRSDCVHAGFGVFVVLPSCSSLD